MENFKLWTNYMKKKKVPFKISDAATWLLLKGLRPRRKDQKQYTFKS